MSIFLKETVEEPLLAISPGQQVKSSDKSYTFFLSKILGFAIVTMDKAALWTDGRYFLQASKQLSSDWILMKAGLPETPSKEKWLAAELQAGQRVGVDPALISFEAAKRLKETLCKVELVPIEDNLIDLVWGKDQPAFSPQQIDHLPIEYSGKSSADKINELRSYLKAQNYSSIILSSLDEIACKPRD